MATAPRKTLIITDPIYQVMEFGSDPAVKKALRSVVDTHAFQRLRRISQVGLTSLVFPGATHTRFSHSLGACFLASQVLNHLKEQLNGAERQELKNFRLHTLLAALLHDVGHGPFSHSFEHVLSDFGALPIAPSHEEWTSELIGAPGAELYEALNASGVDPKSIAAIFRANGDETVPSYLKQVVSSQVDVDRMDYLVRDSHYAGVEVGKVDVWYLIHCLAVARHGEEGPRTLGLSPKGVKAYEAFVLGRQLMNRTVYYHHKVKVFEFMIEQLLRSTLDNLALLDGVDDVRAAIPPYFHRLRSAIDNPSGAKKEQFLRTAHEDYLRLSEAEVWTLIGVLAFASLPPAVERLGMLAGKLLRRDALPHYTVVPGKLAVLKLALESSDFRTPDDYALVDLRSTAYKEGGSEVFVCGTDGTTEEVSQISMAISAFKNRPESEAILVALNEKMAVELARFAQDIGGIDDGALQ